MDATEEDICRVCRSEGTQEKPLYHPCVCTGSIKFIHQECLLQWLQHSRKEYCELCKHRFAFTPIYSPDMPSRLPVQDIFAGLLTSIVTAIRYWFHYTMVAVAWLSVVPLTACKSHFCFQLLMTCLSVNLLTFKLEKQTSENILADCLQGCFVVTCTLCAFISLVWLREQIVHGGAPQWLEQNPPPLVPNQPDGPAPANEVSSLKDSCVVFLHVLPLTYTQISFCPYHIGHFSVVGLGIEDFVKASHFDGLVTTVLGYILLAGALVVCHTFASLVKFQRSRRLLGVCYIVVKVSLLVVMEIGLFPLICGWWLDICSLEMFDATLKDREQSFDSAPSTTMFLHWLVGMVYVFYFASFILLLREVLRPGVLWFLRNLNDPDFNPIQEMIHLPIYRHLRRFILSVVVFGSIVLLMLWLPIRIIKLLFTSFLPYNVMLYSDAPVSELSLELLLLQVVLPALLEQGHTRQWLKRLVHAWTFAAGYVFDLHSYLLGEHDDNENQPNIPPGHLNNNRVPGPGEGLHAAHQAILQQGGPVGFQPYHRPPNFPLKITLLVVFMCVTLLLASLICLTLPVCVGRWLMALWMGNTMVHELYTAASGLYVCWLCIRAATVLLSWMPQGRTVIMIKVHEWTLMIIKTVVVAVMLAGVIPLLLGLLFELVIVAPLRVPLDHTPLFYPWQDWALGVLHAKIIAAITLMGPQWWLKAVIEQVYANGIRNLDLHFIVRRLAAPVICVLLLSLCVPYTLSKGIAPLLGVQPEMQTLVERRIYPFLLMVVVLLAILSFQIQQFKRLYEHIKNDKYLVGQRLVNYERKMSRNSSSSFSSSS
uniref:E3 ubiquitin-protein ligase MARCHF6 n=1 Tax=Nothobranchius furzeri TaxID=105023 RepID=A0A8C6KW81_NOTFU